MCTYEHQSTPDARRQIADGRSRALQQPFVAPSHATSVGFYLTRPLFDTAASTTVLEDFEGVVPKDTPLASFVSNGVTYTGLAGSPFPNVWVASPGYNNFGAGVTQPTTTSILVANGDEDFTLGFSTKPFAVDSTSISTGWGRCRSPS